MAEYANIIVDIFNEKLDKTFQKKATVVAIFPIQKRERKLNIAFDSVKPYFGLGLHCCFVLAVTIMFYETK